MPMRIRAHDFTEQITITIVGKNPDRVQRVRTHLMEFINHFTQDVKDLEGEYHVKLPTVIEATYKGLQFDVTNIIHDDEETHHHGRTE